MRFQIKFKFLIFVFSVGVCAERKNVLFLMIDDLRPQLNAYSGDNFPSSVSPQMVTPNIDKLANQSLLLQRAYVQQAQCSPSRASLLTGRRPDTTHVYDLTANFREVGGNFTTIPQYFKQQRYKSVGMGKIFHPHNDTISDDPISWSEPFFHGVANHENNARSWEAVPESNLTLRPLRDRQLADKAIETIRDIANATGDENFFLAVGFRKPHEPFVFPESFLSTYPENLINLPRNQYAPESMPEVAWSTYNGLRRYDDIALYNATGDINTTLPEDVVKELRRAYYCAVTWIDSLVGEIIDELETQGLLNDTIISLVGDHGYQLGEHGEWGKRTNFELSTHAPMMIRIPNVTDAGIQSEQLVEFVDLFPTLVEAAGLGTIPRCSNTSSTTELCHEGSSLMPLVENPDIPIKEAAFSQTPSPYPSSGRVMGYTMRTEQYRYTEWPAFRYDPHYTPNWKKLSGVELYDHEVDPDENINRADDDAYTDIKTNLSLQLRQGWMDAILDPLEKRVLDEINDDSYIDELISWLLDLDIDI
ncbi:iduronate 2-sulfatase-like [Mercenaria mercenaria]|uniref:iduronate 2-sulfatase-like n=1 Tax=Mercenaria mercenaria TaxID=6596 RepID=UPI00234F3E66|nr:iduronate 2-sulfatase-like [Mercenaria mercenaria]